MEVREDLKRRYVNISNKGSKGGSKEEVREYF